MAVRALDGSRAAWSVSAARHLRRCPVCRDRLTGYERVVAAGRLTRPGQTLQQPPPRVWAAVRAGLAADSLRTPPATGRRAGALRRAGDHVLRGPRAVVRAVARHLARLLSGGPRRLHA